VCEVTGRAHGGGLEVRPGSAGRAKVVPGDDKGVADAVVVEEARDKVGGVERWGGVVGKLVATELAVDGDDPAELVTCAGGGRARDLGVGPGHRATRRAELGGINVLVPVPRRHQRAVHRTKVGALDVDRLTSVRLRESGANAVVSSNNRAAVRRRPDRRAHRRSLTTYEHGPDVIGSRAGGGGADNLGLAHHRAGEGGVDDGETGSH